MSFILSSCLLQTGAISAQAHWKHLSSLDISRTSQKGKGDMNYYGFYFYNCAGYRVMLPTEAQHVGRESILQQWPQRTLVRIFFKTQDHSGISNAPNP